MIPEFFIQEWKEHAPWAEPYMVEQDLIICRALVSIFSDDFLASQLAFRGGTALHKLYLAPQPRYSEDIDLVQITAGPIKPIMYRLGEVLDWLPNRITKQKRYNNTMLFRVDSETPPVVQIRLKVEINCFEHFNVLGLTKVHFNVKNSWFTGEAELVTYQFEELLGTKLRALYQRKKGVTFSTCMSLCNAKKSILPRCWNVISDIWNLLLTKHHHTSNLLTICRRNWLIQSSLMTHLPCCVPVFLSMPMKHTLLFTTTS